MLGVYAKGSFKKFLSTGMPELVYKKWTREELESEIMEDVERIYGRAPGPYMSVLKNDKSYIAVARIRFGNVVILPQPLPAYGENTFSLIHGAKKAPPHPYIASYLWAKKGFKADAVIHFGTHGSLEFTPWKQVALSQWDWPDALMGGIPHIYVYVINNVGEAIIAKRRSYAVITSHLTPAFDESRLYGELGQLRKKINSYLSASHIGLKSEYRASIRRLALQLKLEKDLQIKNFKKIEIGDEIIKRIDNYLHVIENEKITQGLYRLGIPYRKEQILQTARLMAIDGVAYSMATLDRLKGRLTRKNIDNGRLFKSRYRNRAKAMINNILLKGSNPERYIKKKDIARLNQWDRDHKKPTEAELIAAMLSFSKDKKKKEKDHKTKNSKKTEQRLKELIVKIGEDDKKRELLLSMKKEKQYKKISGILDSKKLRKARSLAKIIPKIGETLETATKKDMIELIRIMQDELMRKKAFEFLDDNSIKEEIEREHEKVVLGRISTMLKRAYMDELFLAINEKKFASALSGWDKTRTELFNDRLLLYKEHNSLHNRIQSVMKGKNAIAIAAILKRKKSIELVNAAFSKAERRIADFDDREHEYIEAVRAYSESLRSVKKYQKGLMCSPNMELAAVATALSGGYIAPSSGGDAIKNPNAVPTGRNLYAIDAETTPSEEAWKIGVRLAISLIKTSMKKNGKYPHKVAFTLWGGEFIRSQGATLAQILYLLGVEPVRNSMGVVYDLKLIPADELKRPRIDVVVQTSGQFRDIAASRIYLINKAVRLASQAEDNADYENYVEKGSNIAERIMKEKGLSPKESRLFSTARVFGGVNGNYGAAIMGLVESGDKWEDDQEIAQKYLNNMGALYTKENWGRFTPGIFEAALSNTDTVVHPRSSNITGALSLDHVYEFMGGINIAIRSVSGNDPDSYFNDLRNSHNPVVKGLKEAIWTETRTTLLNPKYIKEMQRGGASSAETFAETFRNTYGWNVMKPSAIDREVWDNLYDVYIKDKHKLGVYKFFKGKNPYALQEMTAVMLETIRKGLWKPGEMVVKTLSKLHAELVRDFNAGCSGFVCDNSKLQDIIMKNLSANLKKKYSARLDEAKIADAKEGMKLKKEEISLEKVKEIFKENLTAIITVSVLMLVFSLAIIMGAWRRRNC